MEMTVATRLKHARDVFTNREPYGTRFSVGPSYGYRPDRPLFSRGNERSIITSVYNRIALDVSSMTIQHVRLDDSDRFKEIVDSGLNNCLTMEANVDQTGRAFIQDVVMSMLDEGCVAIVPISCDYGGFCKGHGSDGQHTTYGAMMYGSNGPGWEPYIIVTNAGARISGTGADLVVSGGITMSEEPSYGSDLRIKNSIDYDLASYEAFFLALKPSTFKYNKGTSGRKHFGFIAQDVEQAMLDTGLTSDQLAALVKDPVKEILSDGITDYRYSIRYGELITLNTHMIQKLYQMVEELLQQKEG